MKTDRLKALILANAAEIERLSTCIRALAARCEDHESKALLEQAHQVFEARFDMLAFPGGYSDAYERIAAGNPAAIEAALCFLELRPRFIWSGSIYKRILREMQRLELPIVQASRLAAVISAALVYRQAPTY